LKTPKLVLGLLVLNLAVVAALLAFLISEGRHVPSAAAGTASAHTNGMLASPSTPPVDANVILVTNQFLWGQLESENYHDYIARLRAIACPEATIRDIIIADLDKLLAPELRALYGRRPELAYWHPVEEELANDVDPREVSRKSAEIEKRKRDIVRELIGADLARERMELQGEEDFYERRLAFLPEERRTQVRLILEKYQEAEQRFREKELEDGEPLDAGDRAQLRAIVRDRENELSQLLSADEKAQFELWLSPSANDVRHALYGMNATEQEFLTAYYSRRAFDEKWSSRDEVFLTAAERAERELDQQRMEADLRAKLGDERYALYQRGQDEDYHSLSALATRFKLPREKAAEVYGYKKVAEEIRAQVRANSELSDEQKQGALKAIAEETTGAVRATLGDRAFRYYLRTGQATWIGQ
jgi:hypothetical protein